MPRAIAVVTAAVRSVTCSFSNTRSRWLLTVASPMPSSRPVSGLDSPTGLARLGSTRWTSAGQVVELGPLASLSSAGAGLSAEAAVDRRRRWRDPRSYCLVLEFGAPALTSRSR